MKKMLLIFIIGLVLSAMVFSQNSLVFSALEAGTEEYEAVLKEVYNRLNIDVTFRIVPAERALQFSNTAVTDGEIVRAPSIAQLYPNLRMVPTPISALNIYAYVTSNDIRINSIPDLVKYKVGIMRGIKATEQITKDMKPTVTDDLETLYKMLEAGRFDVAVGPPLLSQSELEAMGFGSVIQLPTPLLSIPLHHFLHKKHEALIPRVDMVLKEMTEDGTAQEIIDSVVGK